MTIFSYYNLKFIKVNTNRFHFVIIILAKKNYTGGTESGFENLSVFFFGGIIENQNSDFVTLYKSLTHIE